MRSRRRQDNMEYGGGIASSFYFLYPGYAWIPSERLFYLSNCFSRLATLTIKKLGLLKACPFFVLFLLLMCKGMYAMEHDAGSIWLLRKYEDIKCHRKTLAWEDCFFLTRGRDGRGQPRAYKCETIEEGEGISAPKSWYIT